jgi:hypothetical protein
MRDEEATLPRAEGGSIEPLTDAGQIVGFYHSGISVADLDRSLRFYCGALGLEIRPT